MAKDNLEHQYDLVIGYIKAYRAFVDSMAKRRVRESLKNPNDYVEMLRIAFSMFRQLNPLSSKSLKRNREWTIKNATDEEKRSPFYAVITNDYPPHELSVALEKKFPEFDFEKIKKLHELKKHLISRFNILHLLGGVLTIATLLLKSVPQSVVKHYGIDYEKFEHIVFLSAIIAIVYLFIVSLPLWLQYYRAQKMHEYAGDIIEYTAIRLSGK